MIFTPVRAQHVYEAMCLMKNVGGRLSTSFGDGTGMYTESSGRIVVYARAPEDRGYTCIESYQNQNDFSESYAVNR